MTDQDLLALVVALLVMCIGCVGSFLPLIPGTPVILVTAIGHKLLMGPRSIGWFVILLLVALTIFSIVLDYCRRSANLVGRRLLHLFKRTTESDLRRSDAICTSLQLINFWQDVDVDYTKDRRVYLPQDEMARFGVNEQHLRDKVCDDAWKALLSFQTKRTRELMLQGAPLGRSLPGRIGLEIRATVQGGLKILDKIERAGYDVFRRRPTLKSFDWPLLLLKAV